MCAKPILNMGRYGSLELKLEGYHVTVDEWKQAQENETRTRIIVDDTLFKDTLGTLIKSTLSPKVETLAVLLESLELNDRARLAYVLGLIDKGTMQDLHRIHNIRNKWAHLGEPKFTAKEWKRDVLALSTVGKKKGKVTEKNYLEFFWDAVQACRKAILDAMRRARPKAMQLVDLLLDMKRRGVDMDAVFRAIEKSLSHGGQRNK